MLAACRNFRTAFEATGEEEFEVDPTLLSEMNEALQWMISQSGDDESGNYRMRSPPGRRPALNPVGRAAKRSERRYRSPLDVKVLVIDDSEIFLKLLTMRLRALGFDVHAVLSGGAAIEELL